MSANAVTRRDRAIPKEERQFLPRVKVLAADGTPMNSMDFREARLKVRDGLAVGRHIKGEYHVQLKPRSAEAAAG